MTRVCPACSIEPPLGTCRLCRGHGFVPTPELSRVPQHSQPCDCGDELCRPSDNPHTEPEPTVERTIEVRDGEPSDYLGMTTLYLMSDGTVRWRR